MAMKTDRMLVMPSGLPRLLTSTEVAEALGVNPSTVSRWRSQGIGPRVYWLGKACPRYRQ